MATKGILGVIDVLEDYSKDIQNAISETAIKTAKNGASKLKKTSPKRTGSYAKGWRVKTEKGFGFINCTIHNATDYQLTHLLENEHLTRNGGKYTPKNKHIKPVHDECVEEFENDVKKIIENGGK